MKTTLSETVFKTAVLPLLKEKHRDAAGLERAINDSYTVLTDDGSAEVEVKAFVAPYHGASSADIGAAADQIVARLTDAVSKGLKPLVDAADRLPRITGGSHRNDDERAWGFKHIGEYLGAVHVAGDPTRRAVDPRLRKGMIAPETKASPAAYSAEAIGADGGFLVPPDFLSLIMKDVWAEENLLGRCNRINTASNNVTLPVDETTPWQTAGGVQSYWAGEAASYTPSKPQFRQANLQLHKLTTLVPVTEEMLSDAALLASYIPKKASEKIDFKLGEAIFRGSGDGEPMGFIGSGAAISQTKETSQAAATINVQNIARMFQRLSPASVANAVWLIQPDCWNQLLTLQLGNYPMFQPPISGFTQAPQGALFGRPVLPTQHCNTLGTSGDIILADLSQYLAITRADALTQQTSMHLWFDQDLIAYKFTFRLAGQPWRSTPIQPRSGNNTLSHFVMLEDRT